MILSRVERRVRRDGRWMPYKAVFHTPREGMLLKTGENFNPFSVVSGIKPNEDPLIPIDDSFFGNTSNQRDFATFWTGIITGGFPGDITMDEDLSGRALLRRVKESSPGLTIVKVASDKMKHWRHVKVGSPLTLAQMLALTFYTSADVNYDMCWFQRNVDYSKYPIFDACLLSAIKRLWIAQTCDFPVFSGLKNIEMHSNIRAGFFNTFVSTSSDRRVAEGFKGSKIPRD